MTNPPRARPASRSTTAKYSALLYSLADVSSIELMSTSQRQRIPTQEEQDAVAVLKAAMGTPNARIIWREEAPNGNNYDADLILPGGKTAKIEVTSSDGGVRNLESTHNRFYRISSTKFMWTIEIRPLTIHGSDILNSQEVKQIVGEIAPILKKIEEEYMDEVDARLFDPTLYNSVLQSYIRPKNHLKIKITNARQPDNMSLPGVNVKVLLSASLQLDGTDILAKRIQQAIDHKNQKDQGASWLVILMCDFGGGAEQLRELCNSSKNPPNGASAIENIDLSNFGKVVAYAKHTETYAFLHLDTSFPWRFGLWRTEA